MTYRASLAAAALLAAPLTIAAQQQQRSSRAGWRCGAKLDPSYFQVAEGTGGQLLLLAPEEIGDSARLLTSDLSHDETIFRLAGTVPPGVHEFRVPIDPSVESEVFSVSVQCLQLAEVLGPSGEHALTQVEFAWQADQTFRVIPWAGVQNTIRIRVSGHPADVHASIVSGGFDRLGQLALEAGKRDGEFVSQFSPDIGGFRVLVVGKDADGFAFQRMHAPLLTPMA